MGKFKKGESGNPAKVFQPGESGNPAGRPKGALGRAATLRKWLDIVTVVEDTTGQSHTATVEDALALSIIKRVLKSGDAYAYQTILDNAYGKLPTTTNLGLGAGDDGEPTADEIQVTIKRGNHQRGPATTPAAAAAPAAKVAPVTTTAPTPITTPPAPKVRGKRG